MQIYVEHWGGDDFAKLIIFDIWEDVGLTVKHCIFSVKNAFENLKIEAPYGRQKNILNDIT